MFFEIPNITGFASTDETIIIFDKKNKPFYFKSNNKNIIKFNLPKGKYYTDNYLIQLPQPIKYEGVRLPKFERKITLPAKFKIIITPNPRRCSIYIPQGIVKIDTNLLKMPYPFIYYVLLHELGHYFYKPGNTEKDKLICEKKCDEFANFFMLKSGYNPSQAFYTSFFILRNTLGNLQRKINILNINKQSRQI